jgi:hypothetical protein
MRGSQHGEPSLEGDGFHGCKFVGVWSNGANSRRKKKTKSGCCSITPIVTSQDENRGTIPYIMNRVYELKKNA